MLALIDTQNDEVIISGLSGGWMTLPDGRRVSPIVSGWTDGRYEVQTVAEADSVPANKVSTGTTVQVVDGQAKYVHTLEDLSVSDRQAQMLADLASKRFEVETAGIILGGALIKTDRETNAIITGAYVQAQNNPDFLIRWKIANGLFTTLNSATIIAIGDAVTQHIQACFNREDELTQEILDADSHELLDEIDIETGWPETA